jgi:hypothetical protein
MAEENPLTKVEDEKIVFDGPGPVRPIEVPRPLKQVDVNFNIDVPPFHT